MATLALLSGMRKGEGREEEEEGLDLRTAAPPPQRGDQLFVSPHISHCILLGPPGAFTGSAHPPKQRSLQALTGTHGCNTIHCGVSCDNPRRVLGADGHKRLGRKKASFLEEVTPKLQHKA